MSTNFQQVLMGLASSLHILPARSAPLEFGDAVDLKLAPELSDLNLTSTIENLVNVTWLTKTVNFQNDDLLASPLAGEPSATPPQPGTIEGNLQNLLPPVSGVFGQIEGMLPIPVRVPVTLSVTWKAYHCPKRKPGPHGPLDKVVHSAGSSLGEPLVEGVDYVLPNGSASPDVSFLFGLVSAQPVVCVIVVAEITLTALGSTATASPHIQLLVPTLEVPPVAFIFRRVELNKPTSRRRVLVAIPDTVAAPAFDLLMDKLRVVRDLARKVRQIRKFVRFVTGVNLAIAAVSREKTTVHFQQGDEIENFVLAVRNVPSSMIVITPPDSWVEFYEAPHGWTSPERAARGQLNVGKTGALISVIRNLYGHEPAALPDPGASQPIHLTPHEKGFDDCLSSLRFQGGDTL